MISLQMAAIIHLTFLLSLDSTKQYIISSAVKKLKLRVVMAIDISRNVTIVTLNKFTVIPVHC